MLKSGDAGRVATLWNLTWNESELTCVVSRTNGGMQLTVESLDAVVISERFELQPRALSRARALRDALKRRGWKDLSDRGLE